MEMAIETGNAHRDSAASRDWLLGHFIQPGSSLRRSEAIEVKWHAFSIGDERSLAINGDARTAVCVLIRGRLRIQFEGGDEVLLSDEGDYAIWQGVGHTWQVEEDGLSVVIRWPSLSDFS
jgi:hypothetical protein